MKKPLAGPRRLWVVPVALVLFAGCDVIPPEYEKYWVQFQKQVRNSMAILLRTPAPEPEPSSTPEGTQDDLSAKRNRDAKANAELLREIYKVVYMREPTDRSEFGSLVDSINQGASLEGMYNGFTHSAQYRKVETANAGASPEALKLFGQELALFEVELPIPAEFSASATLPLALPVDPGAEPVAPPTPDGPPKADGVNVIEYGKVPAPGTEPSAAAPLVAASPVKPDPKVLSEKYQKQFVGASIFTLKRILGDEALKVVSIKRQYPEKLAHWYSQWVIHMSTLGVDYGVSQRNKPDEAFHYKWALTASVDRVNWEVLNRVHRVLNEANRQKQ